MIKQVVLGAASLSLLGAAGCSAANHSAKPVSTPSSSPATTNNQAPPSPQATQVEFVITGSIPYSSEAGNDDIDVQYGSDSQTYNPTLNAVNGTQTYTMPFNGTAQYYSVDVDWASPGSVTCKIVVTGTNMQPQTVSTGTASGGSDGAECDAQAAPDNSQGTSWQNEG